MHPEYNERQDLKLTRGRRLMRRAARRNGRKISLLYAIRIRPILRDLLLFRALP